MITFALIGIFVLLISLLLFVALLFFKIQSSSDEKEIKFLREQLHQLSNAQAEKIERTRQDLDKLLKEQNQILTQQLKDSQISLQKQLALTQKDREETNKLTSQILKEVTEKMSKLEATNKNIMSFAEQLQSLENILKNPKQRGILGEYFLETILKNVLPPGSFQMQYKFRDGTLVDAAIFVKDKIIPVDSKFSLENYNKIVETPEGAEREKLEKEFKNDLKKRIDETAKYIRPSEGTMEFAFMFIPSEGIYYDLLVNQIGSIKLNTRDLIEYAFTEKRVIIVSPTNFLAYLQTVLQGLRALQIEESAKEIMENVRKLKNHLQAFDENFSKLGKNLNTTVNFYNKSYKELGKIDKDIVKITGETMVINSENIDDAPNI
ncbi:MAG: hypothetical protein KatS3mg085_485 [Candidatus Dojkabacteria bacterium]|nr:MAG: hypothetical protein KatS3mg085_485 [Candidatus Dojkabacteria bacterium]